MTDKKPELPEGSIRLKDLQLTIELLVEAVAREDGARERIAQSYSIQKSVITDRVKRVENFFKVELFSRPQRKAPTEAGRLMAEYGPRLVGEIGHFARIIQDVQDSRKVH